MGFKVRAIILSSVMVFGLAYYARPRFPDTVNNPGLKSFTGIVFGGIHILAKIGGHLGIASHVNITRYLFGIFKLLDDGGNGNILQIHVPDTIAGVKVLIFRPRVVEKDTKRPGIVYYHGGGWTILSPDGYAAVTRELAEQTQSIVISVDYRLAPEHLFPAGFDDCLLVTKTVLQNAEKYGIDENKVGIMGDSAGGNLAMAVALALTKETDASLPKIKQQTLIYPALQAFDFNLPAYIKHENGPGILRKQNMIEYWLLYAFGNISLYNDFASNTHVADELRRSKYASYVNIELLPQEMRHSINGKRTFSKGNKDLSEKIEHIILDPRFAPLMATDEDLTKLPPTYIVIPEFDVLRDDGFLAAARLRQVGVTVEYSYLPGEEHGLISSVAMDNYAKEEAIRIAKFFNRTVS